MALLATAGVISLGVAVTTGSISITRKLQGLGKEVGLHLFGTDLEKIPKFYWGAGGFVPLVIEVCCGELEKRCNKAKPKDPLNWTAIFQSAHAENGEISPVLDVINQFRDPTTRNVRNIPLKPLNNTQLLEVVLFFLCAMPQALCTEKKYAIYHDE